MESANPLLSNNLIFLPIQKATLAQKEALNAWLIDNNNTANITNTGSANSYNNYEHRCLVLETTSPNFDSKLGSPTLSELSKDSPTLSELSKDSIIVNHFVLIPSRKPYNFNVLIESKEFIDKIWEHILNNYRHEFWSQTIPWEYGTRIKGFIKKGNQFYYDNRPKVFVLPSLITKSDQNVIGSQAKKDRRFLRYNICSLDYCEIAVVDHKFRRIYRSRLGPIKYLVIIPPEEIENKEIENYSIIGCQDLDQVFEYIDAPNIKPIGSLKSNNPRRTSNFQTNSMRDIRTYTTTGYRGMSKFYLHKKLRGFALVNNGDYVRVDYNKKNYSKCVIKNNLILESIKKHVIKDSLSQWMMPHITLADLDTRYSMNSNREDQLITNSNDNSSNSQSNLSDSPSDNSNDFSHLNRIDSEVWIAKASTGDKSTGGLGIYVIGDYKSYLIAKKIIEEEEDTLYVIQKYIVNPILFKGKKCHFRLYILVTSWGEYFWHKEFKIITAKEEYYKYGDSSHGDVPKSNDTNHGNDLESNDSEYWQNKDIHDSHLDTTDDNYTWPKDKEFLSDTNGQPIEIPVLELAGKLAGDIKDVLKPSLYPDEAKYGYRILGADIMFTTDKNHDDSPNSDSKLVNLILLEINVTPYMAGVPGKPYRDFEKKYLEWEYSCIEKYL